MNLHFENGIKIIEVKKNDISLSRLKYRYTAHSYYDLTIQHKPKSWQIKLTLKPLKRELEKTFESRFFENYIDEPRAFAAKVDGKQTGWIEVGYHKWNNRMRIWEILIREEFRRKSIGTMLLKHAVQLAHEKRARMLVLETQSCNVPAIKFYLKNGFELIGFDSTAYSNEDTQKKEVRLELGLRL